MAYNILFISHERKMGGANCSLIELAKGLQKLGNNVAVVVLYRGCPIDKKLRSMGIETFPCFFGWWQQPEKWPCILKFAFKILHKLQWISIARISHFVRKNKIDIIHSNSSVIDVGAQVAEKTGCKHVWHFREYGKEDYYLEYMAGKDESIKYITKHSDAIIFISKALRDYYKEFGKNNKIYIVYDGIVPKKLVEEKGTQIEKLLKDEFVFLVTGNISQGKNQRCVVEAVNILVNQMGVKKSRFKVYFAGAATSLKESKDYLKELKMLLLKYNLENVIFKGYVEDMKELRKYVDAEIVPSKSEAYGRVTLEAMLSKNLVIASKSGANLELIGEEMRGLLFLKDNPYDLAKKMLQAMNEVQYTCIEGAYEYVKSEHIREDAYKKVQDIYHLIMEKE